MSNLTLVVTALASFAWSFHHPFPDSVLVGVVVGLIFDIYLRIRAK